MFTYLRTNFENWRPAGMYMFTVHINTIILLYMFCNSENKNSLGAWDLTLLLDRNMKYNRTNNSRCSGLCLRLLGVVDRRCPGRQWSGASRTASSEAVELATVRCRPGATPVGVFVALVSSLLIFRFLYLILDNKIADISC